MPIKLAIANNNPNTYMPLVQLGIAQAKLFDLPVSTLSYDIDYYPPLVTAVSSYNGLLVIAAGNAGINNNSNSLHTDLKNLGNVIFVANSTASDNISAGSNYGTSNVDLAAPV